MSISMTEKVYMRELTEQEMTEIYQSHLVEDFPAGEVKPLAHMLEGRKKGQYEAYGLFEKDTLKGYAYFIKNSTQPAALLDYFAIVRGLRSAGYGSLFLKKLQAMCIEQQKLTVVKGLGMIMENPDYETREDKKVLMHRRIAFYQKNGMQLSGVTCNFYDNEYRIMYAGAHCEDTKVQEITMNTYLNFFGADVVRKRAVFHAL